MMSGRMHRAIASIACGGIPELFTGFFLRAKFSNFPPVRYEIFKVQLWMCGQLCIGWHGSFRVETENADTCQAVAFSVSACFLFHCLPIL